MARMRDKSSAPAVGVVVGATVTGGIAAGVTGVGTATGAGGTNIGASGAAALV